MHPAKSVIFFTTISGAGFGLIALISLAIGFGELGWHEPVFMLSGFGVILSVAGLISSTFHLGNPQRAWRALTQIQSSWLSREGALAILTLGTFVCWAGTAFVSGKSQHWIGFVIAGLCFLTIYATAMIYAQLKTVPRWHSPLTPISYIGFGLSSGMILLTLLKAGDTGFIVLATLCLAGAWLVKILWWQNADKTHLTSTGSSLQSATGLSDYADISLFESPHMTKNYLMREMVFEIGRKHAQKLRRIALLTGCVLPLFFIGASYISQSMEAGFIMAAAVVHLIGLMVERWLFFAEAEHVVAFYYGKK